MRRQHLGERGRRGIWSTTWIVVGGLVLLLAVVSVSTAIGRVTVGAAVSDLNNRVLPAQDAANELVKTYVDQETGQRGFLLTGNTQFLQPYESGRALTARLISQLSTLLTDDQPARQALHAVDVAGAAWLTDAAEPEIAARQQGAISQASLDSFAANGKQLFDRLRQQLTLLQDSTTQLTNAALRRISAAQDEANVATIAALALAALVAAGFVPILRRLLTSPMSRLVDQVELVADGDYNAPIDAHGPREVATVAQAVAIMRDNLVESTQDLVAAQRELTLRTEQARVATELQSMTTARVFALGLALSSAAGRPTRKLDLQPFIDETDNIVRDLRSIAFDLERGTEGGLRADVDRVAEAKSGELGFRPTVEFAGPVDAFSAQPAHAELVAILDESLDNGRRSTPITAITVRVTATHDRLALTIFDDATISEPRTTVEWHVPRDPS
ncbi:MAG TPA: CHASE3 domain-containing protein [Pseudonocardiaceae bacterium]|jgi:CHASE3 domain sensor protein